MAQEQGKEVFEFTKENFDDSMTEMFKRMEAKRIAELTNQEKLELAEQEYNKMIQNTDKILIESLIDLLVFKGVISHEEMEMAIF